MSGEHDQSTTSQVMNVACNIRAAGIDIHLRAPSLLRELSGFTILEAEQCVTSWLIGGIAGGQVAFADVEVLYDEIVSIAGLYTLIRPHSRNP
jgi:hypothetical protein